MSKAVLKIEFLGGTLIQEAIKEAKEKAIKYDLAYIEFNFNGSEFAVGQTADVEKMLKQYPKETHIVSA